MGGEVPIVGVSATKRLNLDELREAHYNARQLRMRGTGITGYRNEYLKALSESFADNRAATVVPLVQRGANEPAP